MSADLSSTADEATFGSDPWAGAEQTLFDRTGWEDREAQVAERFDEFDQTISRLEAGQADENRRLQEVITRLQARIYGLEDELEAHRRRDKQFQKRLLTLAKTIQTWKPNEP